MGIIAILAKPNVKKLKVRQDINGLIKALRYNRDRFIRWDAAWSLGDIGDTRAVEPLIQALNDEDEDVQGSAAEALGKIGDARAVKPLIQLMSQENGSIRKLVKEALANIRTKETNVSYSPIL